MKSRNTYTLPVIRPEVLVQFTVPLQHPHFTGQQPKAVSTTLLAWTSKNGLQSISKIAKKALKRREKNWAWLLFPLQ